MSHGYSGPRIRQRWPQKRTRNEPKYRLIYDPGHGWLEVTHAELVELRIAHLISAFSYTTGPRPGGVTALVYLEEDCDLARFADAKGWQPREAWRRWREVYQETTFVRSLAPYSPPDPPAPAADPHEDKQDEAETLRAAEAAALDPGPAEG